MQYHNRSLLRLHFPQNWSIPCPFIILPLHGRVFTVLCIAHQGETPPCTQTGVRGGNACSAASSSWSSSPAPGPSTEKSSSAAHPAPDKQQKSPDDRFLTTGCDQFEATLRHRATGVSLAQRLGTVRLAWWFPFLRGGTRECVLTVGRSHCSASWGEFTPRC